MWSRLPSSINSWYLFPISYKIIDSPVENRWISTYSNRLIKVIIYSNFFLLTAGGIGFNHLKHHRWEIRHSSQVLTSPSCRRRENERCQPFHLPWQRIWGWMLKMGDVFCLKGHILSIHFFSFTDLSWFVINQLQVDVFKFILKDFIEWKSLNKSHESTVTFPLFMNSISFWVCIPTCEAPDPTMINCLEDHPS